MRDQDIVDTREKLEIYAKAGPLSLDAGAALASLGHEQKPVKKKTVAARSKGVLSGRTKRWWGSTAAQPGKSDLHCFGCHFHANFL